ncbi:recombinase family protein [Streptomyces sp. NPDC056500]|uniref:recombinase family protein n=1 Tax=Streptomyces sp. NPDC056500 TaxID=3345840 RepID=UPI00367E2BAC
MAIYGYARADSTGIDDQAAYLQAAGCTEVFSDFRISTDEPGPGWRRLIDAVQDGDTLRIGAWSRLTRRVDTAAAMRDMLATLGVRVEVVGYPSVGAGRARA